jgi:hypothetical protein
MLPQRRDLSPGERKEGKLMRLISAFVMLGLLMGASIGYANVLVTGVSVTPNPTGVNDSVTIRLDGVVNTVAAGQLNCTGVEIFFGDVNVPSTDPTKPAGSFVRFQPASTASFPYYVTHQYTSVSMFTIIASAVHLYNGKWYSCASNSQLAELTVLGDTIQSIKSITPAVVNQQTSVVVKGLGSCSQNVQVDWGDGGSSTIAGPVNLKVGGVASHTYATTGTKTAKASGSVCDGMVTTTISVALMNKPGQVFDRNVLQNLRNRLDRFAQLPPPPAIGGGPPNCPICAGLAQQIGLLDQSGRALQAQSAAVVKDLTVEGGKGPARAPITSELVKQLDRYFMLRTQLIQQYGRAGGQTRQR